MGTMQTLFVLVINSIAYGIFMFYDKEVVDQTKYKSHLVQTHTKHVYVFDWLSLNFSQAIGCPLSKHICTI